MTAHLRASQLLLVHGSASDVGNTPSRLRARWAPPSRSPQAHPEKFDQCRELGAEHTINYRDDDFVARMLELGGADAIRPWARPTWTATSTRLRADGQLSSSECVGRGQG